MAQASLVRRPSCSPLPALTLPPVGCPGPAYDLSFSEVRSHSLVLLWKAPVYTGTSALTGYLVDMAKKGSSQFEPLHQEPVSQRHLQVRPGPDPSRRVGVPHPEDLPPALCRWPVWRRASLTFSEFGP